MFNSTITKIACSLIAIAFMSFTTTSEPSANRTMITLRAGTSIALTLNETVDSREVQIGNSVEFLVRSDVTVNGRVVIAAGSIAEGIIKKVENPCERGCDVQCAKLEIVVETAQAVDGRQVNLRSVPFITKGNCCGKCAEPAIADIGTKVSARVQNDVKINA